MVWCALWDSRQLTYKSKNVNHTDLSRGTLIAELALKSEAATPVVLWQGRDNRAPRLTRHSDGHVSFEFGAFTCQTPAGYLFADEPVEFIFRWDIEGQLDLLQLRNLDTGNQFQTRLGPMHISDLSQIVPRSPDARLSIRYAGLANHLASANPIGGIAPDTPIDTPDGPVIAADLRPGMAIRTEKRGTQTIEWIGQTSQLARGRFAPVRMRAPYFGLDGDLNVSREQRILLSGSEVDYVFGTEQVLARASDLIRQNAAQISLLAPVQTYVHLLLEDHDCVSVGRCQLDTSLLSDVLGLKGGSNARLAPTDRDPHWPVIDRAGAQTYLSMLMQNRRSAA